MSGVSGGDFATAYRVELADRERVFVKTHNDPPENFFSTEAAGLEWLRDTGTVNVPQVLAFSDEPAYLALEWIDEGRGTKSSDESLGQALAALHQCGQPSFGRQDRRTTGSLAMPNEPKTGWAEFYATQRLQPLIKIAEQRSALSKAQCTALQTIADNLSAVTIASDEPSLLHGDLWAGNRIVDRSGISWLIDPAAHRGHREFDLSMMQLFGGYSDVCFHAYHEVFPITPDFESRIALHQLAPLLVHLVKFGDSYKSGVLNAIKRSRTLT